jgi:hypothetical protein
MMSSLCFNIALDHMNVTWETRLRRFETHGVNGLFYVDSYGYHNPESKAKAVARVFEAKRRLPKAMHVYRLFIPNPDNPNNGDNHQLFLEPEEWADNHPEFVNTGIYIAANCEPTHWDFQRTADWLLAVAKIAKARGLKVALAGFNVGGYEEHHIPMLDELLRFMAANPGLAVLDCHEYFKIDAYSEVAAGVRNPSQWPNTVDPAALWHLGRYKRIFAYCDREGIARPDVIIGEHGPDKIDNVGGGIEVCRGIWAGYGFDPDWYHAEMLKWADRVIYTEPQVKFRAYYQLSDPDSGNWPAHNAAKFPRFMTETATGFRDMTIFPSQPTSPPPKLSPKPPGVYNVAITNPNVTSINLRSATGAILTTLRTGARVEIIDKMTAGRVIDGDPYDCYQVQYNEWRGALLAITKSYDLEPVTPAPDRYAALAAKCRATSAVLRAEADKLDAIATEAEAL